MDYKKLTKNLLLSHYAVSFFHTGKEAADYLDKSIDKKTVGIGDSLTIKQIGAEDKLITHNEVFATDHSGDEQTFLDTAKKIFFTDIYLTSVNAIAETGEMVNIDGTGNRVASSLFGHHKVYFILGKNKIAPTLDEAVFRARNTAAPLNAKRLNKNTPCVKTGKCMNCLSPDRICNAMTIYYKKMSHIEAEVILIDEDLGF